MPTYEYECKSCSHSFEVFQSMSDPPVKNCPECGKEVRRLIFGGAGVIFKGSGFYVTDKSKGSGKTETKSASSQGTDSAAKGDSVSKQDSCGETSKERSPERSSTERSSKELRSTERSSKELSSEGSSEKPKSESKSA